VFTRTLTHTRVRATVARNPGAIHRDRRHLHFFCVICVHFGAFFFVFGIFFSLSIVKGESRHAFTASNWWFTMHTYVCMPTFTQIMPMYAKIQVYTNYMNTYRHERIQFLAQESLIFEVCLSVCLILCPRARVWVCLCVFVYMYMWVRVRVYVCMYVCMCVWCMSVCVYVTHTSSASSWGVLPTNDLGVQGASTCMYWNVCVMYKLCLCMSVCSSLCV